MVQSAGGGQIRGINRTVCIGLGGTGRDVLMRIKRLIVDRYGDLTNLPIVSFVHIDTDKTATQISGLRTGSTYHGVDLSFTDAEKISATMTSTEVNNFLQGVEKRSNYERQGPYDHIMRWFPPQLLRNIKAVEEGAKGIRPVGRLAFFHNYKKIESILEKAENRTRGHEANLVRAGLRVEPGLNIFVVGSLCGGTGSGMFLDVAYSLRKKYGDQGAQIVGYLVISPELYGNTPNMIANTYAALKELNHYTSRGSQFEACYDLQDLTIVQENRPPFDYTYLVSNQTNGEYKILEQRKLSNVIAHKIALDFSNELAPVVKGMRDNFLQHLIQEDDHPRPNTQRYLTFGLGAIYFPRDVIVKIALTKISLKLVRFWLNGMGQSPDPQVLLEKFLLANQWHNDLAKKDGFQDRLANAVQESNKTFANTLSVWRSKLEKQIVATQNQDDRKNLRQQLLREFREQFRKTQPGETDNSRGIWLTRLEQIRPKITSVLQLTIDDYLRKLLVSDHPNFGIKNLRNWLDALQTELDRNQRLLEENIANLGGFKKIEDVEKKCRDTEQLLDEIEAKLMPFGKNQQCQDKQKGLVRQIYDLIKHNFDLAITQQALAVAIDLQEYVRSQINQMTSLCKLLETVENDYDKEEKELRQLNFDEMTGEAIFDNTDIEQCYETLLPESELKNQLNLVSRNFLENIGKSESLYDLMGDRFSHESLEEILNLTVDRLFGESGRRVTVSVIKRFIQNYSASERTARLGQIMQEASPLLRLNLSDPYFRDTIAKQSKLVGFKDTDEPEVKQFKTILTRDAGISETVLKPTQAEDEILIVTEYAGFPLRLIQGLNAMRNPYIREKNLDNSSFLHTDFRTNFTDIIPPDAVLIEKLEDVFYPCLAFNLLEQNQQTRTWDFPYYDSLRDTYSTTSLSPVWNQALEELANRQDLADALSNLLNDAIARMEEKPQLWEEYYLPQLRKFVEWVDRLPEIDPNFPYKGAVVGIPGTTDHTAKEGVINRFRQRMADRFRQQSYNESSKNILTQSSEPSEIVIDSPTNTQLIDRKSINYDAGNNQSGDKMSQLKDLAQMKKDGLLTEEEFIAAKKQILGL